MSGTRWSRYELVLALSLYFRMPFGKMHSRNAEVVRLANAIGRTPGSVALKLVNLASLDPELKKRSVAGMAHASQLDREIWGEFYGQWELLARAEQDAISELGVESLREELQSRAGLNDVVDRQTESLRFVNTRVGQSLFRQMVFSAYQEQCCITGLKHPSLLRASHIVPWSINAGARLDPRNGLCLNALHDAAFDRGLITIGADLKLMISGQLAPTMPAQQYDQLFDVYAKRSITRPERFLPSMEYLEYHRSHVFVA